MESIPAFIEVAKSVQDNKGLIKQGWEALMTKLHGKKSTLIFTGLAGAGKTTLFDRLSGKTEQAGYKLAGRSAKIEKSGKKLSADSIRGEPKKRLAYVVIPGQNSSIRQQAFEDLFKGSDEIAGIVHVVSAGLPILRERVALQVLAEKGIDTIEKFRQSQLEQELDDLDQTCKAIERYMTASHKPIWMIVALNKIDLFPETINQEISLYSKASSQFTERLRALQNRVGSLYFDWDVAPVSAWLEDFTYNNEKIDSTLRQPQQQAYLKAFIEKIVERC